ncbi:hypothetical protein [Parafrankia sp. EUN1f]|uniref:hypothetical protein n=1 Tax=Parafrankia sp. EUN1f TaxID=102897 RepID=UPI0001C46CCF|nr:hypothetical protein [Parafrankia sp. EUN1f]EFC80256.1 hypothetical protein FrEUN1fDRAFT_6620 [Parafrankia sp. EUN1f]
MPRPTDWSPLGLSGDPTPGDPEVLGAVADYMHTMAGHAQTADTGLTQVVAKSGEGAFVGKTADWLRDTITTAIRDFIGGVRIAFEQTEPAVRSYISALQEAQSRADAALTEAIGLTEDNPRLTTLTADAKQAASDLNTAAGTAAETIRAARDHIHSPNPKKSACEVFWEIFGWIVLAITVVAVFVGGPLGLVALGLNAIIATKTVIDFAEGKTNVTGLVLGLLGLLGPSTKPLISLATLKSIGAVTWKIVKDGFDAAGTSIARVGNDFWQALSTITFSAVVKGVGDISATIAKSVLNGSVWAIKGFTAADGLAVQGFVALKNFVVTAPAAFVGDVLSVTGKLPAALTSSIRAVPGFALAVGGGPSTPRRPWAGC